MFDFVLKEFYSTFESIFEDTELAFKRKIIYNAEFNFTPVKIGS